MEFIIKYFRNGYRRVKRYIAWFPILWKDEDWDSAYLFEIMKFKISRIREEMNKNKRHLGYEKNIRQMKVAEELLARIGFSCFYDDLFELIENNEKKGKCVCPENTWDLEPISKTGCSIFVDLSCNYCKELRPIWIEKRINKEKEDLELLFCLLKKHSKKWWD